MESRDDLHNVPYEQMQPKNKTYILGQASPVISIGNGEATRRKFDAGGVNPESGIKEND